MGKLKVLVLLLVSAILRVDASYNLYIKAEEQMRIFGIKSDLYYVREGVLNQYALNFLVPLPPQVNSIHLTWAALDQKPLPYTISSEVSDSVAMDKPVLNISSTGYIPVQPETFRVDFPCTGIRDSEVIVELTFNVSTLTKFKSADNIPLIIKRRKVCYADPNQKPSPPRPPPHPTGQQKQPKTKNLKLAKEGKEEPSVMIPTEEAVSDNAKIIYIIVGCSFGLVIIIIALASAVYVRSKKGSITGGSNGFLHIESGNCSSGSGCGSRTGTGTACSGSAGGSIFIRPESPHHYSSVSPCPTSGSYTYSSFQPNYGLYTEISPVTSSGGDTNSCKMAEMAIQRCKVRLQSVIMEGTFAKIYKGTVLEKDGSEEKAIIKTVNDHSSPIQMALLLHDGLAFVGVDHKHVYTVTGVAGAGEDRLPPFVIYPDDGFRNLKSRAVWDHFTGLQSLSIPELLDIVENRAGVKRFLHRCRSGPGRPITAQEIVHMAIQIGSGIAFLHRQNLHHRDVAARNCVVDDKSMTVKISDNALSKDLFPEDYHWTGESESRPIKWMPPEAITPKCNHAGVYVDMWSYGVLLWELATLAQQPYAEIPPSELVSFLRRGFRLSQPINCPDELYSSMTRCWTWDPDDRPKWTHILPELQSLHAQLAEYV